MNLSAETNEQNELRTLAQNTKYACDLLIAQCGSWLSEEEGSKHRVKPKKRGRWRGSGLHGFIDTCCNDSV